MNAAATRRPVPDAHQRFLKPDHWVSADSVPEGTAVYRPPYITPGLLAIVTIFSAATVLILHDMGSLYGDLLAFLTGKSIPPTGSLGFRPFFSFLILSLAAFAPGSLRLRLKLALLSLALYLAAVLAADVLLLSTGMVGLPSPFSAIGTLIAGFIGVIAVSLSIFRWRSLPADTVVPHVLRRPYHYSVVMLVGLLGAGTLVVLLSRGAPGGLEKMRELALLGGLGPGIVLLLPLLALLLFCAGSLEVRRQRARRLDGNELRPSVAFLVPAFNEARGIDQQIRSLDRAAASYEGVVKLYVVDNGSTDPTAALATRAIDECLALDGIVLTCIKPGKAVALNLGLRHVAEDVVVRVDADTLVEPSLLGKVMWYFRDPRVGAVGGLTLPLEERSLLGRLRKIEVYENAGFRRVGQCALDAVLCVPGIMAAYRRDALEALGGFGEGFNGEDGDVTVRIGRLGYRVIQDPTIHVFSEVPASLGHLREQRLRWSRSTYHVAARNRSAIRMRQGARGLLYLPSIIFYCGRTAVIIPLLLYGAVALALEPSALFLHEGVALLAAMVGISFLADMLVLILYRQLKLLPFIPVYLAFRLFRSYVALEAILTLPLDERRLAGDVTDCHGLQWIPWTAMQFGASAEYARMIEAKAVALNQAERPYVPA